MSPEKKLLLIFQKLEKTSTPARDKVMSLLDAALHIMEVMTRARTHLCVILVKRPSYPDIYSDVKEYFQQAADHKLVSMVELPHKLEERERAIMRCH